MLGLKAAKHLTLVIVLPRVSYMSGNCHSSSQKSTGSSKNLP